MTPSSALVIIIGVFAFAAFATVLAWVQLYARPASSASLRIVHPKRHPF